MSVIDLIATVYDLNNQHTASCCNFPSMHASRQRGPDSLEETSHVLQHIDLAAS
jgi:hypothetical protein